LCVVFVMGLATSAYAQLVAGSPEDAAYTKIVGEDNPDAKTSLLLDFEKQFPQSKVLPDIYVMLMGIYQQKNDTGKANDFGEKAIKIDAAGNRRSADVVPAAQFRRYRSYSIYNTEDFEKGICFFTTSGDRVANYPKQHSENCTAKHQATRSLFKPMVRILKNLRNKLISDGSIPEGAAPSYFLEALLYNVPNEKFGGSYLDTMVAVINWILSADQNKFVCANHQYYLLGDSSAV